jgi:hypothetical protein
MNMKSLRNIRVPKIRPWVIGLILSVFVLASSTLLVNAQYAVAHAGGSGNSEGTTIKAQIDPQAALNNGVVDVGVTWSCAPLLPPDSVPQPGIVISLQFTQHIGGVTIASSGEYDEQLLPLCDGTDNHDAVSVPSPAGGPNFQAGTALVSNVSVSISYYANSLMYDLVTNPDEVSGKTVTIKPAFSISMSGDVISCIGCGGAGITTYSIAYDIVVNNSGHGTISKVTVKDVLPTNAGLIWHIINFPNETTGPWSIDNGVLSLSGNLARGAPYEVTISSSTTLATCTTVTNTATATSKNAGIVSTGAITVTCP